MKRRRHAIYILLLFGLLAVGLWLHFRSKPTIEMQERLTETQEHYEICRVCGSERVRHRSLVNGAQVSANAEFRPSPAFTDLLGNEHGHRWAFSATHTETHRGHMIIKESIGDGFPWSRGRTPNAFTEQYNESRAFRAKVAEQLKAGKLTRDAAMRIVELTDIDGNEPEAEQARALLGDDIKRHR